MNPFKHQSANNLLKKNNKAKRENKVKIRIIIDVIDSGDNKEDVVVQGPFGGSEQAKITCLNIMAAAQMKVCQYKDEQTKIKLPNASDITKINEFKKN